MASESEEQDQQRRDEEDEDERKRNSGDSDNDNGGDNDGDDSGGGGGGGSDNGGGSFDFSQFGNGGGGGDESTDWGSFFSGANGNEGMSGAGVFSSGGNRSSGKDSSSRSIEWGQPDNVQDDLWARITNTPQRQQSSGPSLATNFANSALRGLAPNDVAELRRDRNSNQSFSILAPFAANAWRQESGRPNPNQNDPRDMANFNRYLQDWAGSLKAGQNPPGAQEFRGMLQQVGGQGQPLQQGVQPTQPRGITYNPPQANNVVGSLVNAATATAGQTYTDPTRSSVPVAPTLKKPVAAGDPASLEWLGRAERAANEANQIVTPSSAWSSGGGADPEPYGGAYGTGGSSGNQSQPPLNPSSGVAAPDSSPVESSAGTGGSSFYDPVPTPLPNAQASSTDEQIQAENRPVPYRGEPYETRLLNAGGNVARNIIDAIAPRTAYAAESTSSGVPEYMEPGNMRSAPVPPPAVPEYMEPGAMVAPVTPTPPSLPEYMEPGNMSGAVPVAGPERPDLPAATVPQPPPTTAPIAELIGKNPLLVAIGATLKETTGAIPASLGQAPIHIANGIAAMVRGDEKGTWAEPYLNKIAQLAWWKNENGGESQGLPPEAAPASYIDTWKENWAAGDTSSPLQKDLNLALKGIGLQSPSEIVAQRSGLPSGQALVNAAMQEIGKPYAGPLSDRPGSDRWGRDGWDCSSFVVGMYQKVYGVNLGSGPGSAYTDDIYKKTVAVAQPQPGDLVFYKYHDPGQAATYPHMGIFISPGKVLDARGVRGPNGGVGIHDDIRGVTVEYRRVPGLPNSQPLPQPRFTKLQQAPGQQPAAPSQAPPLPAPPLRTIKVETGANFVRSATEAMADVERETGIPAIVIAAVAANETGNGGSGLAKNYNNFGGIKADPSWKGKTVTMPTEEVINGRRVTIQGKFRAYDTPQQGLADFAHFVLAQPRYKNALKFKNDPERFIREVHTAGYATDPEWSNKIIRIMRGAQTQRRV